MLRVLCSTLIAVAVLFTACDSGTPGKSGASSKPAAPTISAAAKAEAGEIFKTRCVTCHGEAGAGDGPASAALDPKPRNLQDKTWQASVQDDYLEKIIGQGGPGVGKSAAMPGNPDLVGKAETLKALVAHVRGLAK
jgi:mono/diheme cytochrome c family protein